MRLIELPEEILIMIVKKLDLKSKFNFYNTCQYSKNIICIQGVVTDWYMPLNTWASLKTLQSDFFKDVAHYLQELNISGVIGLSKKILLPVLKRMKHLKILDVSYTHIDLTDFIDMYAVCPSIKTISINFVFDKPGAKDIEVLIAKCQNIFKNMDNIHFVGGSIDLLYSDLAHNILAKSDLNVLKISIIYKVANNSMMQYHKKLKNVVKFKEFSVYFMNAHSADFGHFYDSCMFGEIAKFNIFEYIVINSFKFFGENVSGLLYATPIFEDFFISMFGIKPNCFPTEFEDRFEGNMVIMIFNRESITFDNEFFSKLYVRIKEYFPKYFKSDDQTLEPNDFDWFYTIPPDLPLKTNEYTDSNMPFKKKRIANPSIVLDYDTVFKQKEKIMLTIQFKTGSALSVSLSSNGDYLSKITFLNISGLVRYSIEFFNLLFRCCTNLETFDIFAPYSPCFASILRSVPLSKSLKNIRLIDYAFDYAMLFNSLSQCKTLENVVIQDRSTENTSLADPTPFFKNCVNLYNVLIKVSMTNEAYNKIKKKFNNVKTYLNMPQLLITLYKTSKYSAIEEFNYHPSLDVFNLYPIKPGFSWYVL